MAVTAALFCFAEGAFSASAVRLPPATAAPRALHHGDVAAPGLGGGRPRAARSQVADSISKAFKDILRLPLKRFHRAPCKRLSVNSSR